MSTSDMKKAREWAELANHHWTEKSRAAAELIQSLPDTVVDGDKLRGLITRYIGNASAGPALRHLVKDLEALLPPSLPTLADMTPEEREACRWMQAISDPDSGYTDGPVVIVQVQDDRSMLMWEDGSFDTRYHQHITPLPDLPKLEWPGQEAPTEETQPAETLNNPSSGHSADLPRPEDVPAGEAWLVGIRTGNGVQNDQKFFGIRSSGGTWELFDVDEGWHSRWGIPSEITLVSRLVPEDKP